MWLNRLGPYIVYTVIVRETILVFSSNLQTYTFHTKFLIIKHE